MNLKEIIAVRRKLELFLEPYRSLIGRSERMTQCHMYVSGLMLNGERKTIEPMAQRLPGGNEQNLQQFVSQSPWSYKAVMQKLLEEMGTRDASSDGVLILDDTTLPKKGSHSVGVGHQYCGALGKLANCQCVVTWHYGDSKRHWPVNGRLYLPADWTNDRKRMNNAGVPKEHQSHQETWRLALTLLDECRDKVPHRALVFDSGYGKSKIFLKELDQRQELFVGAIPEFHAFWPLETPLKKGHQFWQVRSKKKKARQAASWVDTPGAWERIDLPTKKKTFVHAKIFRVREIEYQRYRRPGPERWLILEKEMSGKMNYYISNFPKETSLKELILTVHRRWVIEQGYQRLKEELGLDHFEGRSWLGLHHHLTLCFLAYCFLLRCGEAVKKTVSRFPKFDNGSTKSLQPSVASAAERGLTRSIDPFSFMREQHNHFNLYLTE